MRFLADQCVPASVINTLQSQGHEVLRLKDHMPTDSPDRAVIAKAQELDSILLSFNGDFADIVSYPPSDYKGIVSLQVRNHPEVLPQLMERLLAYLAEHPDAKHYAGKLFIVEAHRIRIHA